MVPTFEHTPQQLAESATLQVGDREIFSVSNGQMTRVTSRGNFFNNQTLYDSVLNHAENQIKKFEWDNWLPVKLIKPSILNYLSNKAMKFGEIYSNAQDINEAGGEFVKSLGTVDKDGAFIPIIQHTVLDFTENHISDSPLPKKVIVETTDILFGAIKPFDSLAYSIGSSLMGAVTPSSAYTGDVEAFMLKEYVGNY